MDVAPEPTGPPRWISVLAFSAWLLLVAITWGYLPGFRRAWGTGLLLYLPDWLAWLLAGVALLFTTEEARRGAIAGGRWLAVRARALPPLAQGLAGLALALAVLWLLRDRVIAPDARAGLELLAMPGRFAYPETGQAWLLDRVMRLGRGLGMPPAQLPQLVLLAGSAVAVLFVVRGAQRCTSDGRATALVSLLALSGGVGAALAGRVDSQGFLLPLLAVYLWGGLRRLEEPGRILAPALALGLLIWLEPFALLLLPSLAWLLRDATRGERLRAIGLALGPLALFVLYLVVAAPRELPFGVVVAGALGSVRGWVGLPGRASGIGTDYVVASLPHLKYLANAGFVLAGGSLAALVGLVAARRAGWLASPPARFLAIAAAGLVVAAFTTRPPWGPWDWEVFATTGLALAFLAGTGLAQLPRATALHLAVAIAALQLCFVALPLAGLGYGFRADGGPLIPKRFDAKLPMRGRAPAPRIAPWL